MPKSRKQVFDEIRNHGLDKVKNWASKISSSQDKILCDQYIKDYEESLASERREAREEESLSISRKALLISKIAMISAIIATIIAAIAIILNIITTP